jgi:hypothetical protein
VGRNRSRRTRAFRIETLEARFLLTVGLDPTFSGDGQLSASPLSRGFAPGSHSAIAVQDDKKIVVGGDDPSSGWLLARYTPAGVPDSTFGTGGIVTVDFGVSGSGALRDIAIQPDGKILAVGLVQTRSTC